MVLMEQALKADPQATQTYVRQFIGRWWITYTEMGVPVERQFQASEEELRLGRGPVYEKLRQYAEEVAQRWAKFPAGVVLRAWDLGVMNWRLDGHTYPVFDIGVLLKWLKDYVPEALREMYPDGWPGQKRLAPREPEQPALPEHQPTVDEQWAGLVAMRKLDANLWTLCMAGGAHAEMWQELNRRLYEHSRRMHASARWHARQSWRMELAGLLNKRWQSVRRLSHDEAKEMYGQRLGAQFPSRNYHWKLSLYKFGHLVMGEEVGNG